MDSNSSQVAPVDDSRTQISNRAATQCDRLTKTRHMDPQLYKAAAGGKTKYDLRQILKNFHDLGDELTPMENTVLHIAAQFGKQKCVDLILKEHSDSSLLRRVNKHGDTPLHLAAREGYQKVVEALIHAAKPQPPQPSDIENGVEFHEGMLRTMNQEGDTALHEAVRYRHPKVVKLLIKEDAKFTYGPNHKGNTPLYMAAERGFDDLVDIILENSVTSSDHRGLKGRTALHAAVISKHPEMVYKILEWKKELIKEVDDNGWSPLHCAAYLGYTSIARQLLDKSEHESQVIYLGIKEFDNMTALHIAASRGHKGVAKLLASSYPDCCEQVDDKAIMLFTYFIMSQKVDKMALNEDNLTATDIISSAKDSLGRQDSILRKLKSVKARAGPLGWQWILKAINENKGEKRREDRGVRESEDQGGVNRSKDKGEGSGGRGFTEAMKKKGETHLLVATLIATITFAAGLSLPGGHEDDASMAILSKKTAFKIFVVADTTALVLSMAAVCVYFFMTLNNRKEVLHDFFNWGFNLTMYAMAVMMIAFMMGLYTVLPDSAWLVVFVCAICGCFFIFLSYILRKFYSSWKVMIKSSFWLRKFKLFVIKGNNFH
ncbi:Ankyrin repeat-containing protein [Vitis vinifera]|uniref:Ankyrin repeat-containing protein n=1 Tax=Vitis vinifera TaxID=29760 RepID=A0A438CUT2_VITVI|nr:Ankyrin repeat-containing protein [Vitis vinifera]